MFRDRVDAGRQLAGKLAAYANRDDVVVLGIPRGGVLVAFEIAQSLHAPLDVLIIRKLGVPAQKELAMGAIASGGARVLNRRVIAGLGVTPAQIADVIKVEEAELRRREQSYRGSRPAAGVLEKTVILVDDGIATGSSMRAAIEALRSLAPRKIVAAAPVAPMHADEQISRLADEFVCVLMPEWFFAIGEFYEAFPQTGDAEVRTLLQRATGFTAASAEVKKERGAA